MSNTIGTPINVAEKEIRMAQVPIDRRPGSVLGTPIIVEEKEMRMIQKPIGTNDVKNT